MMLAKHKAFLILMCFLTKDCTHSVIGLQQAIQQIIYNFKPSLWLTAKKYQFFDVAAHNPEDTN